VLDALSGCECPSHWQMRHLQLYLQTKILKEFFLYRYKLLHFAIRLEFLLSGQPLAMRTSRHQTANKYPKKCHRDYGDCGLQNVGLCSLCSLAAEVRPMISRTSSRHSSACLIRKSMIWYSVSCPALFMNKGRGYRGDDVNTRSDSCNNLKSNQNNGSGPAAFFGHRDNSLLT